IGAVDGDVDSLDVVQIKQWNAQIRGHLACGDRCRHASDSEAFANKPTKSLGRESGRRASPQTHDLIIANQPNCVLGGSFLCFVAHLISLPASVAANTTTRSRSIQHGLALQKVLVLLD